MKFYEFGKVIDGLIDKYYVVCVAMDRHDKNETYTPVKKSYYNIINSGGNHRGNFTEPVGIEITHGNPL